MGPGCAHRGCVCEGVDEDISTSAGVEMGQGHLHEHQITSLPVMWDVGLHGSVWVGQWSQLVPGLPSVLAGSLEDLAYSTL